MMMRASLRSWLFVPGDSERKLEKIVTTDADVVIIDLEDSVAPQNKELARTLTARSLSYLNHIERNFQVYVRVNPLASEDCIKDIDAVMSGAPDGFMLPKAEGGPSIEHLSHLLRVAEAKAGLTDGQSKIIAIATETPAGVFAAGTYGPAHPRLVALTWGSEDLSSVVGSFAQRDETGQFTPLYAHARTMTLLSAAHANIAAIDSIYADFRDAEGLEKECLEAVRDGFIGKMAIHPAQIATINRIFTPSDAQITEAKAIIATFENADQAGVISMNGKMLDRPHLVKAQRLLARLNS